MEEVVGSCLMGAVSPEANHTPMMLPEERVREKTQREQRKRSQVMEREECQGRTTRHIRGAERDGSERKKNMKA